MPDQIGVTEFFAMEASEYLERLDAVVSPATQPDAQEFVRLARSLRGSALMANQQSFAAAAAGLEQLARAVLNRTRSWDAATRQAAVRAIDDLKIVVRALAAGGPADPQRADQVAAALQAALGTAPVPGPAPRAAPESQRAIIANQAARFAQALDQTASALAQNVPAHQPLAALRKTLQPLRGIAGLADYPPLPDLLDGIERAIAELVAAPGGDGPILLQSAARAIHRAAADLRRGRTIDSEAAELRDFVQHLGRWLGLQDRVVPIESLYFDDAGPHIVRAGSPPAGAGKLERVALVSHGEHLSQVADSLERAASAVQRELRAQGLAGTLVSLASAGAGPLGTALSAFAEATRAAVARGDAVRDTRRFAEVLRQAGAVLSAAAAESESALAQRLEALAAELAGRARAASAASAAAAVAPAAGEALPTAPAAGACGLAASYQRFEQLAASLGLDRPSIEELLAGPPPAGPAPAGGPAAPAARAAAEPEAEPVSIAELCYSGRGALERALSLRDQVRSLLARGSADGGALGELLDEVFDLVQLGLGPER